MPDDAGLRTAKLRAARSRLSRPALPPPEIEAEFDESAYLAAFPDVANAVRSGGLASALEHYRIAGKLEQRLQRPEYRSRSRSPGGNTEGLAAGDKAVRPAVSLDAVVVSGSGAIFIAGWLDDRQSPLAEVATQRSSGRRLVWTDIPRVRRADVETALGSAHPYQYGFWLFGTESRFQPNGDCALELRLATGETSIVRRTPIMRSDVELRDIALGYLANASFCGNRAAEAFANLDTGAGQALIDFNRTICSSIVAGPGVSRFGPQRTRFRGSIVVPLYGIADYLFVQSCAYAHGAGIADYEFIYVVNSPELAEQLHREARIGEMIYGLTVSLVTLPDNAGFGMANNVGVQFARSDRILCVNPDVFPRDSNWAQRHTDLLASLPPEQTRLFGTSLFYDDGSLMHGGMYFEADTGIMPGQSRVAQRPILRVEHYGKGAPPWATHYVRSRPVPAVTGAFMSVDRAWFDRLGGFSTNYVFGHYEDADLCLKSLNAGTPAWLHDVPMWHLEGKGSRRMPQHEGGSLINRWLFTRDWAPAIVPDLIGRNPPLIRRHAAPARTPERRAAAAPRGARVRAV